MYSVSETEKTIKKLGEMRAGVDASDIDWIIKESENYRPPVRAGLTFDDYCAVVRQNYLGIQADRTRKVLMARYEVAGERMPVSPLNITTETAELQAQVYRRPVRRYIKVDDVDVLRPKPGERASPADVARAEAHARALRGANLPIITLEMERISWLAGSVFGYTRWAMTPSEFGRPQHSDVGIFWPDDVRHIPDPRAPGAIWACRCVLLRLRSRKTGQQCYELWLRDQPAERLTDDGPQAQERRGWWRGRFTEKGETIQAMSQHPGNFLPVFKLASKLDQSCMFPEPPRDIVQFQDEINVMRADHLWDAAFNAHRILTVTGAKSKEGQKRSISPGTFLEEPNPTATFGSIPSDFTNIRQESIEKDLMAWGRSNRLSINSWFTRTGNPDTGVAIKERDKHADQKREEHRALIEEADVEMHRLMAKNYDLWGHDDPTIDGEDVTYHSELGDAELIEDPAQKQMRLEKDMNRGIISEARYAVEMGYFATIDEAVDEGGLSRLPKKAAPPPAPGSNDEDEDDGQKQPPAGA